jgi:hypothetical protein
VPQRFDESPVFEISSPRLAHSVADYAAVPVADDPGPSERWAASGHEMGLMVGQPALVRTDYWHPSYRGAEATRCGPIWLMGPHPELSPAPSMRGLVCDVLALSGLEPGV